MIGSAMKLQPRGPPTKPPKKEARRPQLRAGVPSRNVSSSTKRSVARKAPQKVVPKLSVREIAEKELSSKIDEQRSGTAKVLFNHYKDSFTVTNGVLVFKDVESQYHFDFIYAGAYFRDLWHIPNPDPHGRVGDIHNSLGDKAERDDKGEYFIGIKPNHVYKVVVAENSDGLKETGLRINEGALQLSGDTKKCDIKESRVVKEITEELLSMDVTALHSEQANKLREARDIEDILYGGA